MITGEASKVSPIVPPISDQKTGPNNADKLTMKDIVNLVIKFMGSKIIVDKKNTAVSDSDWSAAITKFTCNGVSADISI
jgi:hypothetical protein